MGSDLLKRISNPRDVRSEIERRVSGALSTTATLPMRGPRSTKWVHVKLELFPKVIGKGRGQSWGMRLNCVAVDGLITDKFAPLSATQYVLSLSIRAEKT